MSENIVKQTTLWNVFSHTVDILIWLFIIFVLNVGYVLFYMYLLYCCLCGVINDNNIF